MRSLLISGAAALALLLGACQQDVVVNTPTTPPVSGYVETDTPAPTSANTVDAVPLRAMRLDSSARPLWLRQRIQNILSTRKRSPAIRITRYKYDDMTVYYESAPCCDQYSTLYNDEGGVLCHPEGGITGRGDERCGNFNKRKTNELLVWQDPR